MSFPLTINDLSAEWLSNILNLSFNSITKTRIGETTGYSSEVYRVSWDDNNNDNINSVVIKFPNAAGLASPLNLYKVEILFYKYLNDNNISCGINHPKFLYVDHDNDCKQFILIIEDCKEPYSVGNLIKGINIKEAKDSIEQIAKFHAFWWGKYNNDKDFSNNLGTCLINIYSPFIETLWSQAKDIFIKESLFNEDLNSCIEFIIKYGRYIFSNKKTLVHGDFRVDNTMVWRNPDKPSPNNRNIVIIDFQILHWGNPMEDLAYFISSSISVDNRKQYEEELLKYYYTILKENGVNDYSYNEMIYDYKEHLIYSLVIPAISGFGKKDDGGEKTEIQKEGDIMTKKWRKRCVNAVIDNKCFELLQELSEKFNEFVTESKYPNINNQLSGFIEYYDKSNIDWKTYSVSDYRKMLSLVIESSAKTLLVKEEGIESFINYPANENRPELRVFTPSNPTGKVVLYISSAWVGGHDVNESTWRILCKTSKSHIIVVKYKSCPEYKFVDMLADCYKAFESIINSPDTISIPKCDSIAIIGDKQGSHLATCLVSLLIEVNKSHLVDNLLLICPWLDSSCSSETFKTIDNTYGSVIGTDICKWHWNKYFSKSDYTTKSSNPLSFSKDILIKFPKTFIITADQDVTRGETEIFVKLLQDNNIKVEHINYPKVISLFTTPYLDSGKKLLELLGNKI